MKNSIYILASLWILGSACDSETVADKETNDTTDDVQISDNQEVGGDLDNPGDIQDSLLLDNGILIRWYQHGNGAKLQKGEMISIDYKVLLDNGTVVDGNHLLKKQSLPFMVGFGMQTPGWDIAMKELKVGDFVEIYLPSEYARGEKGVKGLIPPNSSNILKVRVLDRKKSTRQIEGNKVWLFEENPSQQEKFDENNQIEFHCMASTASSPFYVNTFRTGKPFTLKFEDHGTVPGLKKALINAKTADRMYILVPASQAYGSSGYQDLVKPNEDILYNVLVMSVMDE